MLHEEGEEKKACGMERAWAGVGVTAPSVRAQVWGIWGGAK